MNPSSKRPEEETCLCRLLAVVFYVQNRKKRHSRSGRQSAFFDLMCRCFSLLCFLVEGCSPQACKLHSASIRGKGVAAKEAVDKIGPAAGRNL